MAKKLARKSLPAGKKADTFRYMGRPAKEQDDFEQDVGIADMACVNQFGEKNNSKYYHAGVVENKGKWYVYLEWGRINPGHSWDSTFQGGDYQFVECSSENDARSFFNKQCRSKNIRRLEQKTIGGKKIYVGKGGKDGYIVQQLATRERGLPDAYLIKDDSGLEKKPATKKVVKKKKATGPKTVFQPQVIALAKDLVSGTQEYARSAQKASGIVPTMEAIIEVRDQLLPAALEELARISGKIRQRKKETYKQFEQRLALQEIKDKKLQDISKYVATIVPRPIPRSGTAEERALITILSSANILQIQDDLDIFEAVLKSEDFSLEEGAKVSEYDARAALGCDVEWIDPKGELGIWVANSYLKMTNDRHGYLGKTKSKIKNIFSISRPKLDSAFVTSVEAVAKKRLKYNYEYRARLQPANVINISDINKQYKLANVYLGIHGTRAVNVQPIMATNLRLPKALKGVHITGAAFGHGIYFATDWKKSYGYTGHGNAYYGGGGNIKKRGFFMFLNDVIMGKAYMTKNTGSWIEAPRGTDSVAAYREITTVQNDEHIIFDQNYQRIRYLVEAVLEK